MDSPEDMIVKLWEKRPLVSVLLWCTMHSGLPFRAGSESLSIRLDVSNCNLGSGLEVAIYESFDCENFRQISNCRGGMNPVSNGSSGIFNTTEPLTIGQYYYLVMDGNFGDNCDWTFTVLEGSTQVDPLTTSGFIEGPSTACPDISSLYSTIAEIGATSFEWRLNGALIEEIADSVQVDWLEDGVYELCVSASNVCDEAPPSCRTIIVSTAPPIVLDEIICEGESFQLNDTTFLNEAGNYEFNYVDSENCDSTVLVNLEVVGASITDLAFDICDGDSVFIAGTPYFEAGSHMEVLENYLGCDSTINLNLGIIICEIMGETEESPVICHGESSGSLTFWVEDGTPPFSYSWQLLGGMQMGSGSLEAINTPTEIPNLPAGTILISIEDQFGNDLVLIQEVTEPVPLEAILEVSDYNGWNVSCSGGSDGSLLVQAAGGVSPYLYQWSSGATTAQIADLSAGNYALQVVDEAGCTISLEYDITEPSTLVLDAVFIDPNCEGLESGIALVQGVAGGVEPYAYSLNNGPFTLLQEYSGLGGGTQILQLQDANGCIIADSAVLTTPIIPTVELGSSLRIALGETATLQLQSNIALDNFFWSEAEGLSCTACPEPEVLPLNDTYYTVQVTSVDDCTTIDSILVRVDKVRDVYIPNAFSPNEDGRNDVFFIFGGPEVSAILEFKIFSRWGELLLDQTNRAPNDPKFGWDGSFQGEQMPTGVYTYMAEIAFIDGVQFQYSGDVLLLR